MHNARETIGEQIDALIDQDYTGDWEVVLADNGSTDGTVEVVEQHPALRDRTDVRVVEVAEAKGSGYARNAAAALCDGDFLAFVDADDRAYPGWLSALVAGAAEVDLVAGEIEVETLNSPVARAARSLDSLRPAFEDPAFLPSASGCNLGVWRTAFEAVDGFDNTFIVGQDVDFSWRAQLAGFTIGFAADAVMAYRLRDTPRGIYRQMRGYGRGEARAYYRYRQYGAPGMPVVAKVGLGAFLVLGNPLVPRALRKTETERWIAALGYVVGRVEGTARGALSSRRSGRGRGSTDRAAVGRVGLPSNAR